MLSKSKEEKEKGKEMRMGPIPLPKSPYGDRSGKGAERVMAVVIVHSKATFVSSGISFSPLGEKGEG
jgi:hypothetical protein